ncbi:MAG: phenylalanine--tRNA ligase subunit beta [Bacillota bacterium]
MDVPYNWLKSYIDFDLEPGELAQKLTMLGLEVENVEFLGAGLENIIIGKITEVQDHPDADKLSVCMVETGDGDKQIICGAPNVKEDLLVPVAPEGTVLPGGQEVNKVKLRGVSSEGMICSADELGLQEERAEGIMELDVAASPGESFIGTVGLDEYVLQLDLTPNYARCLGLLGIARELAAVLEDKEVKYPEIDFTVTESESFDNVKVEIKDPDLCPRYTARLLKNVEIGPSPLWMQHRLRSAGIRPINNIVDITNYVLLEYNQPLHAFDYDQINGDRIIVRRAQEGENLLTLDDEQRSLTTEDLVIADQDEAIALAGVMGGAESEVSETTTTVLLESACFDPVSIRKTSRRLGLPSEASHRFERGIDIEALKEASNRAAQLMQKYAGAEISDDLVDEYPQPAEKKIIDLDPERVNQLLGLELKDNEIKNMLEKLEFKLEEIVCDIMKISVPSYRNDVTQEADLVEEVARMYGYNNIPVTFSASEQQGKRTAGQKIRDRVCDLMVAMGLDEIISFSLMDKDIYEQMGIAAESDLRDWVEIKNPLNESFSVMRTSLIPNMLRILSDNAKRQQQELRFFELGKVFQSSENERPREMRKLAGGSMGYISENWHNDAPDFYYLKGVLENLVSRLKLNNLKFRATEKPYLHPGRTAEIYYGKQKVGILGEVSPELIDEFDLQKGTSVFQIDFDVLEKKVKPNDFEFESLPKFPPVARDLAVIVSRDIPAVVLLDEIDDNGGELLKQVNLFDVYRGEQISENKKSLAFELLFQAEDRTLTDEEVNNVFNRIVDNLQDKYNVTVRK